MRMEGEAASSNPFVGCLRASAQGSWSAAAYVPNPRLNPSDYVAGIRIRCGMHAFAMKYPNKCSCGFQLAQCHPIAANSHLMKCSHNAGFTFTSRHHAINHAIQATLTSFHISSFAEPSYLERGLRPDLLVHATKPITIDISVTDPVAVGEDALSKRAGEKHAHYDAFAGRIGVHFFPVVLEAYGAAHAECDIFLNTAARELPAGLRATFRRRTIIAIQAALLVGNARVVRAAIDRCLRMTSDLRWWT